MKNHARINEEERTVYIRIAGFGPRLGAYLIDIIPLAAFTYLFLNSEAGTIFSEYYGSLFGIKPEDFAHSSFTRNLQRHTAYLIWIVYCIVMEASTFGGTFGKYMVGIRVVDEDGDQLTFGRSVIRNLSKIISYLAFFLGFISILLDKERRGWHDMFAKTYVVLEN